MSNSGLYQNSNNIVFENQKDIKKDRILKADKKDKISNKIEL